MKSKLRYGPSVFESDSKGNNFITGVVAWNNLIKKLSNGSFSLSSPIVVGQISQVSISNKLLEDYLLFSSKKRLKNVFINNSVDKPYTSREQELYFKTLVSTQSRKTINKKNAGYSYNIALENNGFQRYRVLFPFNGRQSKDGLPDRYAISIETDNYDELEVLLKDLNLHYSDKKKEEIKKTFKTYFEWAKDDISKLAMVYQQAPKFVLDSRVDKLLNEDFIFILKEMSTFWKNSYSVNENTLILNVLKYINKTYLFDEFKKDQTILFSIIDKLDSDYDLLFIQTLINICYDQWTEGDFKNKSIVEVGESKEANNYIFKINPTIDISGKINPKGKVNFQSVKKKGAPDDFLGIINIKSFHLDPLEPIYISPTEGKGLWVPGITFKPFLDKAKTKENVKFYTDLLLVIATAGSLKILQSATAPLFLKILAAIEVAKAPIDIAMQSYVLEAALKKTEEGKWFVENWPIISTTVDITTLGTDLLYNLYKNGPKIVALFRKKKQNEAGGGLNRIVKEAEKYLDDVGSLRFKGVEIKTKEELIKFLENINDSYKAIFLDQVGIKILFRGTTKNLDNVVFSGNKNSQAYGMSTSTDPLRAIVFGIESATISGKKGVLQLVLPRNLADIKLSAPNRRVHYELEVVVKTDANDLSNLAVKEVSIEDARKLANNYFDLPEPIPSKIFDETRSRELMEEILPILDLKESIKFYEELIKL